MEGPNMAIVEHKAVDDVEVFRGVFSRQLLNKKLGGSAAITVGELKVTPNATLPTHVHYVKEALTVLEGEGKMLLEDESFDIKPNTTILAPAGKKHGISSTGNEVLRILFCFPAVEVERILV
jgi:mannose-6-phosphate isomerase-like protein (cupin superfamily)